MALWHFGAYTGTNASHAENLLLLRIGVEMQTKPGTIIKIYYSEWKCECFYYELAYVRDIANQLESEGLSYENCVISLCSL